MSNSVVKKTAKILAIESSSRTLSVTAALGEEKLTFPGETSFEMGLKHSSLLKESCQFLLRSVGWELNSLTHLAVSTGPGSFTALRVGISFARALASSLKIPLIGIPTFELIAKKEEKINLQPLTVLIDSIGEDLFMGEFAQGKTTPSSPYKIAKLSQILKSLHSDRLYVGEGYLRYENQFLPLLNGRQAQIPRERHFPQSKELAELAWEKIKTQTISSKNWEKVVPFYLRPPIAVERLKQ